MYLIGALQGSMTVYVVEFDPIVYELRITSLVGFMLAGNIVDNIGNPYRLMVGLSFLQAIFWIMSGFYLDVINPDCSIENKYPMGGLSEIISSAIVLIDILQLYNWFSQKYIQAVLILYFAFQYLSYVTPIDYS